MGRGELSSQRQMANNAEQEQLTKRQSCGMLTNGVIMPARKKISSQLRSLIESSGYSRYRIAQETGVDAAVLCHFVAGRRGMSLESIDALGEYLGLELVSRRKSKRK